MQTLLLHVWKQKSILNWNYTEKSPREVFLKKWEGYGEVAGGSQNIIRLPIIVILTCPQNVTKDPWGKTLRMKAML